MDLKREIDSYMDEYDAKVVEEKQKAKEMEGIPDEDSWTTVTRVGKKRGIRQEDVNTDEAGPSAKKRNSEKVGKSGKKFFHRATRGDHVSLLPVLGTRGFLSIPEGRRKNKT